MHGEWVGPYLQWKPLVQFANYQAICEENHGALSQVSNPINWSHKKSKDGVIIWLLGCPQEQKLFGMDEGEIF